VGGFGLILVLAMVLVVSNLIDFGGSPQLGGVFIGVFDVRRV